MVFFFSCWQQFWDLRPVFWSWQALTARQFLTEGAPPAAWLPALAAAVEKETSIVVLRALADWPLSEPMRRFTRLETAALGGYSTNR
jgi:hypothetical protein